MDGPPIVVQPGVTAGVYTPIERSYEEYGDCSCLMWYFLTGESEDSEVDYEDAAIVNLHGGWELLTQNLRMSEALGNRQTDMPWTEAYEAIKGRGSLISQGLVVKEGYLTRATPYDVLMVSLPSAESFSALLERYAAAREAWAYKSGAGKECFHLMIMGRAGQGKSVFTKALERIFLDNRGTGPGFFTGSTDEFSDQLPKARNGVINVSRLYEDEVGSNGDTEGFCRKLLAYVNAAPCRPKFADINRKGELLELDLYVTTSNRLVLPEGTDEGAVKRRIDLLVWCENGEFHENSTFSGEKDVGRSIPVKDLVREVITGVVNKLERAL